jgi:hypothetical protein
MLAEVDVVEKPVWKEVVSKFMIRFDPQVQIRLMTIFHAYRKEFSGFAFMRQEGNEIVIYDFVLLDVGSEVYTEIPVQKTLKLMERSDAGQMKVWLHCHPMGNGVPGPQNWSGTDVQSIMEVPLGGVPEMVKWSVSVVLTPHGWVGRIDNYIKHTTSHLPVLQPIELYEEVEELKKEYFARMAKRPLSQAGLSGWTWEDEAGVEEENEEEVFDPAEYAGEVFEAIKEIKTAASDLEAIHTVMQTASGNDIYSDLDDVITKLKEQVEVLETLQENL